MTVHTIDHKYKQCKMCTRMATSNWTTAFQVPYEPPQVRCQALGYSLLGITNKKTSTHPLVFMLNGNVRRCAHTGGMSAKLINSDSNLNLTNQLTPAWACTSVLVQLSCSILKVSSHAHGCIHACVHLRKEVVTDAIRCPPCKAV